MRRRFVVILVVMEISCHTLLMYGARIRVVILVVQEYQYVGLIPIDYEDMICNPYCNGMYK